MSKQSSSLNVTPVSIAIDIVLTGIVWFLFLQIFKSHVPSYEPTTVFLVAGFTALPGAGTFFLCLQMFKVTLAHQRELKRKK